MEDRIFDPRRRITTKDPELVARHRIHCNCGHIPKADFIRLLLSAGVSSRLLEKAKTHDCQTCQRLKGPTRRRQVALPHARMFNECVGIDVVKRPGHTREYSSFSECCRLGNWTSTCGQNSK